MSSILSGPQVFSFTAPYSPNIEKSKESKCPVPWYKAEQALQFIASHGLGVRAVGAVLQYMSDPRVSFMRFPHD